ncbi:MAG: cation:proton antiporter [Acidobacteriota bacterium]
MISNRLITFVLIILAMLIVFNSGMIPESSDTVSPTLIIGFMLLSSFVVGFFFEKGGLPRITGYIISGLVFGPFLIKFYSSESVEELLFLNSLALAFIAFNAGSELRIKDIAHEIKPIISLTLGVTIVVFTGVTTTILLISDLIPFMRPYPVTARIAIASIFGIISVARSPSSAIAIINETRAKGTYTNTILSITVIMDVLIIILFAIVISVSALVMKPGSSFDISFILFLVLEIAIALILGFFLGKFIIFLINKVKVEFSVVIIALGFFVMKFTHFAGSFISRNYEMNLNIEPLLICMAAGFTVQNFSGYGDIFLKRMDKISIPVYVAFFTITGASINLNILKTGWILGLVVFSSRILMIYIGSYLSTRAANAEKKIKDNSWLGFITQAGISLGLLSEVLRRFPEMGVHIQAILIAAITLNQIIGPVGFKYGLHRAGETLLKREGDPGEKDNGEMT